MKKTFSERVLEECSKIPKGRVSTYAEIAKAIGNPKAYRAVGNSLNKNPRPVIVPCHRIIKSSGEIGGFANGKKKKIELLKKEGIRLEKGKIFGFEKVLWKK